MYIYIHIWIDRIIILWFYCKNVKGIVSVFLFTYVQVYCAYVFVISASWAFQQNNIHISGKILLLTIATKTNNTTTIAQTLFTYPAMYVYNSVYLYVFSRRKMALNNTTSGAN